MWAKSRSSEHGARTCSRSLTNSEAGRRGFEGQRTKPAQGLKAIREKKSDDPRNGEGRRQRPEYEPDCHPQSAAPCSARPRRVGLATTASRHGRPPAGASRAALEPRPPAAPAKGRGLEKAPVFWMTLLGPFIGAAAFPAGAPPDRSQPGLIQWMPHRQLATSCAAFQTR